MKKFMNAHGPMTVFLLVVAAFFTWCGFEANRRSKLPPPPRAPVYSYTIVLESGQEIGIKATGCSIRQSDLKGLSESHPLLLKVNCDNVFDGLAVAVIRGAEDE